MKLLIVSTLPEEDPEAQRVIGTLRGKAEACRVITARDIRPCAGCNACWLRTPGICALRDGQAQTRHLRQVGALAAEQIPHLRVTFREQVHILMRHILTPFDVADDRSGSSSSVLICSIPTPL